MTDQEREAYVRQVWSAYLERHGHERMISNIEWCLARHWAVTGVPLRTALRAIAETDKPGRSLLYYEEPVEAAMRRHESPM